VITRSDRGFGDLSQIHHDTGGKSWASSTVWLSNLAEADLERGTPKQNAGKSRNARPSGKRTR